MSTLIRLFTISFISLLLAACGGGGGEISRDNDSGGGTTPPPSDTYSISLRIISSNGEASNQLSTTNPLFIEATVVDGSDSPITGKLVKFEFSNDDLANFDNDTGTALTNDMGVAVIGLRVGANSGSANVIASIDSGEFSSIGFTSSGLDLFVTEPSAVTVEITDALGNPDIMLDVSSPLQVSAKVVNADGESLADQLVTFSLSSSSLASFNNDTGTALTNADGIATIGLLVSSSSGSGKVTASVEGSTDIVSGDRGFNSAGASFSPGEPATVRFSMSNESNQTTNVLSETGLTLSILVQDVQGVPLSDELILLGFSIDGLAEFSVDTNTILTNEQGIATVKLFPTKNSGSGYITLTFSNGLVAETGFSSQGIASSVPQRAFLDILLKDRIGAIDTSVAIDNPLTVEVKAVDENGNNIVGQLIYFDFEVEGLATFNNASGTAITNEQGIASIGLIVGENSGSGSVSASTDIAESVSISFTSAGGAGEAGIAYATEMVITDAQGNANNALSVTSPLLVTVTVTDAFGSPVVDELVTFAVSDETLAGFTTAVSSSLTDRNGVATIGLQVGAESGSGLVTASMANGLQDTVGFVSAGTPPPPDTGPASMAVMLVDSDGVSNTALSLTNPLVARVTVLDGDGRGVAGELVTFDFQVAGVARFNNDTGTAVTDAQGIAEIGLVVGDNSGSGTLIASVANGTSTLVSFTSAGGAGEAGIAYATEMVITDAQGNANNALSVTSPLLVTVTVTDAFGSPVVDELVTFAVSDETLAGFTTAVSSSLTDRNGVATIGLQVGAESGSGLVTASMANGLQDTVGFVSAGTPPPPDTGPASMAVMLVDSDGVSNTALSLTNPLVARVTVLDGDGRGVAGELVTFDFQVAGVARFNNDTGTAVTDAQGIAEIGLVVGDNSGSGTLIASVANGTSTLVSFTSAGGAGEAGIAYNVVVDITGGILSQSNPLTVTASVVDAFGSPVVGELVSFSLSDELVANFSVANASAITDSLGRASIGLEVGEIDGSALVTGAVANGLQSSSAFSSTGPVDSNVAASLDFYVSSERLASSGADSIELIALVRNANSQAFEGAPITFSAPLDDNVNIQVIDRVTRADGTARALLNTLNDATNRTVTVTATTEEFSQDATVVVFGTELTVGSATSSIVIGDIVELTALLVDSDGNPVPNQRVIIASESGLLSLPGAELPEQGTNTITATTDIDGQVLIQYFADISGEDTIYAVVDTPEASAVSEQANLKFVMLVQQDDFKFTSVPASAITLNTPVELIVTWERDGLPLVNSSVTFTSSRGVIDSPTVLTDAQGQAKLSIQSDNAGLASITAVGTDSNGVQVSARTSVDFYADKADRILLGATPDILGPDGQTAAVTAVVRDSNGNVVRNAVVNFVVNDTSGGFISSSQVSTDERGVANAVFTSGAVTSEQQVMITATVKDSDPLVEDFILLTVGNRAFDVSVGTGNIIASPDNSTYLKEFAVFVTDAVGQPIENVQLTASLTPVWFPDGASYSKGDWIWNSDSNLYVQYNYEVDASGNPVFDEFGNLVVIPVQNCLNEDLNNNGELDLNTLPSLDEDDDGNGFLTPGIVGSLTVTDDGTTNEYGQAIVELRYPREFAGWYTADIVVFAQSTGTESSAKTTFRYSIAGADINDQANKPNGSPFGVGRCPVVN